MVGASKRSDNHQKALGAFFWPKQLHFILYGEVGSLMGDHLVTIISNGIAFFRILYRVENWGGHGFLVSDIEIMVDSKQGYALKNWVQGLSDEAYYPWESPKKSTKIGQPYICQQTKECFYLSIKANLQVFQNHRKQAKINIIFIVFYC